MAFEEPRAYGDEIYVRDAYAVNAVQNVVVLLPGLFVNGVVLFVCLRPNKMPSRFRAIVLGTTICNFTGMFFSLLFMMYYLYHYWTGNPTRVPERRIVIAYVALHVLAAACIAVHVAYGYVSTEVSCGYTISAPRYFHICVSIGWLLTIVVAFVFGCKTMIYLLNYERANKISGNFLRNGSWKEVLGRRPTVKRRIGQREVHVQKSIIMGIFLQGVIPLITVFAAVTMVVNMFHVGRQITEVSQLLFSALYYAHYTFSPILTIIFGRPLRNAVIASFKGGYSIITTSSFINRSPVVSL
uniref:G_PROTEIN_RECEP_F1_2 domain-containing protein n=1 Tax=Steinernema glaseri TaxID=37863 RepID=A0A1I8AJV8_9BILA